MKNLVYIAWNPSQHGHYAILSQVFTRFGYTVHFFSGEEWYELFYTQPEMAVAERLAHMTPTGHGIKGFVKRILAFKPLNTVLYRLFYAVLGWIPLVRLAIRLRLLMRRYNRRLGQLCRETNAVAILHMTIPIVPWQSVYFPKVSVPVIAIMNYLVLPPDIAAGVDERCFNGDDRGSNYCRRLANLLIPHWGRRFGSKIIYPARPMYLLSLLACGMSRHADLDALRSRFAGGAILTINDKKNLEFYGNIPAHWEVVGDLTSDILSEAFAQREQKKIFYMQEHGFSHSKILAIDLNRHISDEYFGFLLHIATVAKENSWDVIFCPHPGDWRRHAKICRQYGFVVSEESTAVTLPMADLYVSFESSTCLWAAQMGIPVVSLGVFGQLGTTGWEGSAYFDLAEKDTCEQYIRMLLLGGAYTQLQQKAIQGRANFGMLDGKCGERLVRYVEKVVFKSC